MKQGIASPKKKKRKTNKNQRTALGGQRAAVSAAHKLRVRAVFAKVAENPTKPIGEAMIEVGYAPSSAKSPGIVTASDEWNTLLDTYLPRNELLEVHKGLLKASRIEHLVFTRDGEPSDDEIALMLKEQNCVLRKIVHGEQARHVYFFAPDNKARDSALEMAYKLRGDFAADKAAVAFSLAALAQSRDVPPLQGEAVPILAAVSTPQSAASKLQLPPAVD